MDPAPQESRKHPTSASFSAEDISRDFVRYVHSLCPDPRWHFEMIVRKDFRVVPATYPPPLPGGPMVSLALMTFAKNPFSLEIYGQHMVREIDAADWLDVHIESMRIFEVVSRKRVATPGGDLGDVLVRWDHENKTYVGRLLCMKAGGRLVLLWFRTLEADYPANAELFFATLMSFRLVDDSGGPLAEAVQYVGNDLPLSWRVAVPASWQVVHQPATPAAATFQLQLPVALEGGTVIAGKITFSVIASSQIEVEQQAMNSVNQTIREAGVEADSRLFFPEQNPKRDMQSWILRTHGTLQGQPVAINARVLRDPKGWVIAAAFGPPREQSPAYWMQVKRTIDVMTMTMEFT